jgi:hypothetical protein
MTFQMQQGDGKLRANPQIVQTATNVYSMTLGAQTQLDKVQNTKFGVPDPSTFSETVTVGNATGSFTPCLNLPRASWVSSPCNIKIQLVGPNALFSTSQIVTANAITGLQSVRAINSSLQVDHSPVGLTPGFNEWGGLDHTTKLLKASAAPGGKLTYSMTLTNCQAFLQPSLTKEWTVGQDLGNGVTVASVTDTDVTGTDGLVHAHRPPYVVNALVFMHSSKGGMVQDTDANVGLTTGEIGVLYARIATDSSPTPQTGYTSWSFNGSTLTETLPTFTNPVYPIVLSPAGDTFGYITLGSSSTNGMASYAPVFEYIEMTPSTGTTSSISIGAKIPSGSCSIITSLYSSHNVPLSYVTGSGTSTQTINSSTIAWYTGTCTASITTGTSYRIACMGDSTWNSSGQWAYNSAGSTYAAWFVNGEASCYPNWPATESPNVPTEYDSQCSIYCTYTAGGGGSNPTVVSNYSSPSSITTTGATVTEDVSNIGSANVTAWGTNYGLTSSYGSAVTNSGTQAGPFSWSDALTGLTPGMLYHYQAFATNSNGTATGADQTFFTTPSIADPFPAGHQSIMSGISGMASFGPIIAQCKLFLKRLIKGEKYHGKNVHAYGKYHDGRYWLRPGLLKTRGRGQCRFVNCYSSG